MESSIEHTDRMTVLNLSGRFDAHTAPPVRDVLTKLIDQGHQYILVDMAEVTFVDSTGFSVLVGGMKGCRRIGGDLVLMHLQQPVRIIFELTRLDKAFDIYPDRPTAEATWRKMHSSRERKG